MNYFKRDDSPGMVFYFSDEDIANGMSAGYIPLTEEEVNEVLNPTPTDEQLASTARWERDRQLREVYDKGIQMVRREIETSTDQVYLDKLILKRNELHGYAKALQDIPEQSLFPKTITWPAIPTEELS